MINYEALFKVTYGMYLICSGESEKANGYFSNTFFQITSSPPQFAASCHKSNYSTEIIIKTGFFSVSILPNSVSPDLVGRFGYRSGRDFNKMEGLNVIHSKDNVPVVLNDSIAYLVCKLVDTIEIGTHLLFIGELIEAEVIDADTDPMTYQYYRQVKKGMSPKNAPTYIEKSKLVPKQKEVEKNKYKCTACGHFYEEDKEEIKFNELANDWVCPVCGAEKEDFIKE